MIRLVVVDDHPAIALALEAAIAARSDTSIALVGSALAVAAGLELVAATRPDVVLCDLWIDGAAGGLDVLRALTRSGGAPPRVVVLSGFEQPSFLRAAFEAGAAGYLTKASPMEDILASVEIVARGGTAFPAVTLAALREAPRHPSQREIGAIRLVARGATNDEIAADLGISIKTVESHLRRLFGRYGVLSRTELAMLAAREGWLGPMP